MLDRKKYYDDILNKLVNADMNELKVIHNFLNDFASSGYWLDGFDAIKRCELLKESAADIAISKEKELLQKKNAEKIIESKLRMYGDLRDKLSE